MIKSNYLTDIIARRRAIISHKIFLKLSADPFLPAYYFKFSPKNVGPEIG